MGPGLRLLSVLYGEYDRQPGEPRPFPTLDALEKHTPTPTTEPTPESKSQRVASASVNGLI